MYFYTRLYYYFEQVNFAEFTVIAVKQRKMSASTFLMNEPD